MRRPPRSSLERSSAASDVYKRQDQVREIAQTKMQDLNAADEEAAMRIIEGTARSMGITVQ